MKIKRIKSSKTTYTLLALALVLLAAATGGYFYVSQRHDTATNNTDTDPYGKVDYSPANQSDKAYNDAIKANLGSDGDSSPSQNGDKKAIKPLIVDASQYDDTVEVRALVPEIIENGGKCTIEFTTPSGSVFSEEVAATADASTTRCENLQLSTSRFNQKGTWKVTVTYSSATAEGRSDSRELVIK